MAIYDEFHELKNITHLGYFDGTLDRLTDRLLGSLRPYFGASRVCAPSLHGLLEGEEGFNVTSLDGAGERRDQSLGQLGTVESVT